MTHITEIIPDDTPQWFKEDFASGQLFSRVIDRVKKLEKEKDRWRTLTGEEFHGERKLRKRIAELETSEEKAHRELAQYEAIITEAIYDDSPASLTRYHKIINKLITLYHVNTPRG